MIVAYGVNDIGWGLKADAEHKKIYLDAVRGVVERCKARGVRVFIGSAATTAEDPKTAENGFLQSMCDEGMAIAKSMGEGVTDIQRGMRTIQKSVNDASESTPTRKEMDIPTLHAKDGIHLNDLGKIARAFVLLNGLGAPAVVSSVTIDAKNLGAVEAESCRVSDVNGGARNLEFDRLDDGLPVNFRVFGAVQFRFIPVPDGLNRYVLSLNYLPAGRYEVRAEGRGVGTFPSNQLDQGVNIRLTTAEGWEPGGPWDAQAALLVRLTDARSELERSRCLTRHYLPEHPGSGPLEAQSHESVSRIVSLQRAIARPYRYHFLMRLEAPQKP